MVSISITHLPYSLQKMGATECELEIPCSKLVELINTKALNPSKEYYDLGDITQTEAHYKQFVKHKYTESLNRYIDILVCKPWWFSYLV
jgi:hypothetical protein